MISWTQTRVDGRRAGWDTHLAEGMSWSWQGRAMPLGHGGSALMLAVPQDRDDLRHRARRKMRRLLGNRFGISEPDPDADMFDPGNAMEDAVILSDGQRFFTIILMQIDPDAPPVVVFPNVIPPQGHELSVVRVNEERRRAIREDAASVICFTPGTRLRTDNGDVAIEDLGPGDRLMTLDDGPQEVVWTGHRRMSGARLFAMPHQRPVKIKAGAIGLDIPDGDLLVSPAHRILVRDRAAVDLFGMDEVLVRASDLVGDARVKVDVTLTETFYIHLMLDRHQVIWANGLPVETFHPGYMGVDHLESGQRRNLLELRPEIAANPHSYGAPARRMLDRGEAALLQHGLHRGQMPARNRPPRRRPASLATA